METSTKIRLTRTGNPFSLQALNEEGKTVLMDAAEKSGGQGNGLRPMQLLLAALGGCSAIDVITILNKQRQSLETFDMEIEGLREAEGQVSLFRAIRLHFKLSGRLDPAKVEKAIQLSLEKYCSVARTLEPTANITFTLTITT